MSPTVRAALFDFGGVIISSPFEGFTRYEEEHGLPAGFLRQLNSTDPDTNAWARFERSEVTLEHFADLFEAEALAAGHPVDARKVLSLLHGELRPEMATAVRRCTERLTTACLTNNFALDADPRPEIAEVLGYFDAVFQSSEMGARKPDPHFYELVCEQLAIRPAEAVFLDDLGVNLKPARQMGMTTIKVSSPGEALTELERAVGFSLRD